MKSHFLLLCFGLSLSLYAESWEVGLFGSGLIGHGDLGHYWEHSGGGGFEVAYPFHTQVPVMLSAHISNHREITDAPLKPGHVHPGRDIMLVHTTLLWQYRFLPKQRLHPIIGAGLTNTLFIMYKNWPPEDNADESEYGFALSLGMECDIKERFRLFTDYRFSAFLTDPEVVTLSLVRSGIRYIIPKRSHDKK